jgi:hypothetical protein
MNTVTPLTIPDIAPDAGNLTAALAYAGAGWYVLPVRRGTKKPGNVVGNRWQDKSSHEPEQIAAWFAGTDHGIALHCGRSGAVVFDVDRPDQMPELLAGELDSAPRGAAMASRAIPCNTSILPCQPRSGVLECSLRRTGRVR